MRSGDDSTHEGVKFQIIELEKRLSEVISEQEKSERELESQLSLSVQEIQSLEHELHLHQAQLQEFVMSARGLIGNSSTLRNSYAKVDELQNKLASFSSSHS